MEEDSNELEIPSDETDRQSVTKRDSMSIRLTELSLKNSDGKPYSPRLNVRPASASFKGSTRQSVKMIKSEGNPLAGAVEELDHLVIRVENLSNAHPIQEKQLVDMIEFLSMFDTNEGMLEALDDMKGPYLFSSEDLFRILDVTTSVRSKITIISIVGPRLTDPKARMNDFLNLFRYAEEKSRVEEVLKNRASTLASALFKQAPAASAGGRGGRGLGGRGGLLGCRGQGRSTSKDGDAPAISPLITSKPLVTGLQSIQEGEFVDEEGRKSEFSVVTPSVDEVSTELARESIVTVQTEVTDVSTAEVNTSGDVSSMKNTDAATGVTSSVEGDAAAPAAGASSENSSERSMSQSDTPVGGVLSLLQRPSRAITYTDKPKSSALLRKPSNNALGANSQAGGPGLISSRTKNQNDSPTGLGSRSLSTNDLLWAKTTPVVTPTGSQSQQNRFNGLPPLPATSDSVARNASPAARSRSGSHAVSTKSDSVDGGGVVEDLEEYKGEDESAARSTARSNVSNADDAPKSRYSKTTNDAPAVVIIPSSLGVGNILRKFEQKAEANVNASSLPITRKLDGFMINSANTTSNSSTSTALTNSGSNITTRESLRIFPNRIFSPPMNITPAKVNESGIAEAIIRVAAAVDVEPKDFLTLEPEEALSIREEDGFCIYSYRELVRQNHFKDYRNVVQSQLESHLTDDEFFAKFGMTRDAFYNLAKWKRNSIKKDLFLF